MSKFAQAAAAAVKQGKVQEADFEGGGDFTYEPPAEGPCVARLVSVIEIGNHPQKPYNGQEKPPAPEVIVQFELLGKKHRKEIKVKDETGKETTKVVYPIITERMAIKGGKKAGYIKLLEALRYGRKEMTHPGMLIGEAFKLRIEHNDNGKEGKEKRVYANIKDQNGVWLVSAPVMDVPGEDGELIQQPIKAPPATVEERCLLWDDPDMDQWNSLYIPGSRTKKIDGKETEVSKNWIQETVKSALNFEGSAVAAMIASVEGDLPSMMDYEEDDESAAEADEPDLGGDAPDDGEKAPSDEDDDPLADLGLEDEIPS